MNLIERAKKFVKDTHPAALVLSLLSIGIFIAISAKFSRYMINPDGISYISLAKHYTSGYFGDAINAYWSPMIVWLMMPLIFVGISGQSAFAIVNLLVATMVLVIGTFFVGKIATTKNKLLLQVVYIVSIVPFLGYALVESITPDLLVVLWMLMFIVSVSAFYERILIPSKRGKEMILWLALIGALGAVGYFIKLYLLFFFIPATFILLTIYYFSLKNKKTKLKNCVAIGLITYAFLAVFILPWALALSAKYNHATLGSAFSVNTGVSGSDGFRQPQTYQMLPLPNSHATTAWEDPTVIDYGRSSAFASGSNIKKKLQISFSKGIPRALKTEVNISVVILPIAIFGALLLLLKKISKNKEVLIISLVSGVVYVGGYILAGGGGNERYHWPAYILSVIIFIILITNIPGRWRENKLILLAVFCVPLITVAQLVPDRVHRTRLIIKKHNSLTNIAHRLNTRELISPNSKIAGEKFNFISYIAYYSNTKSMGVIDKQSGESFDDLMVRDTMRKLGVEYFISVEPSGDANSPINTMSVPDSFCEPVDKSCSVKIFSVD